MDLFPDVKSEFVRVNYYKMSILFSVHKTTDTDRSKYNDKRHSLSGYFLDFVNKNIAGNIPLSQWP